MLIDLVMNGVGTHGCLFWHVAYRVWRFNGSLCFRTRPIYVHTHFIRCPAAEYATPKPYDQTLSPRESLACETMLKTYTRSITSYKYSIYSYTPVSRDFRTLMKYLFLYDLLIRKYTVHIFTIHSCTSLASRCG